MILEIAEALLKRLSSPLGLSWPVFGWDVRITLTSVSHGIRSMMLVMCCGITTICGLICKSLLPYIYIYVCVCVFALSMPVQYTHIFSTVLFLCNWVLTRTSASSLVTWTGKPL